MIQIYYKMLYDVIYCGILRYIRLYDPFFLYILLNHTIIDYTIFYRTILY